MKTFVLILLSNLFLLLITSCNTLYNTKTVDIEIFTPSKLSVPIEYRKVAVQYNNVNIAPSKYFSQYNDFGELKEDTINTDSVASNIYYNTFISELRRHDFFDSVMVLPGRDYYNLKVADTINYSGYLNKDSTLFEGLSPEQINVFNSGYFIKRFTSAKQRKTDSLFLHPKLGLYTPEQLQLIRDTTSADMLISLDFFGSSDFISFNPRLAFGNTEVDNWTQWSFYNLKNNTYILANIQKDTVSWEDYVVSISNARKLLPAHTDAILNAAEISAEKYSAMLVPHWTNVQRMYYSSGHVELKQTDELVKNGQWLEAAKIWKANTTNKNKSIAAKCMFNMALACEMEDDLEAALSWVINSYYIFENSNELHAANCMDYIQILGLRKADIKLLNKQFEVSVMSE